MIILTFNNETYTYNNNNNNYLGIIISILFSFITATIILNIKHLIILVISDYQVVM